MRPHRGHDADSPRWPADAIIICVPTPLTPNREPDLRRSWSAGQALADVLQAGQLVVLESTTYPGTTRERLLAAARGVRPARRPRLPPRLLARARRPGPHRLHAQDHAEDRRRPHRRLRATRAEALYGLVCDSVVRSRRPRSPRWRSCSRTSSARSTSRSSTSSAMLADRMGIDIWEVVDAAATKPFGFMRFEPGPGHGRPLPAGRPVLPVLEGARVRLRRRSSSSSRARSTSTCRTSASRRSSARSTTTGKPVAARGSRILGVSYKAGVGDIRESPALKIIARLQPARRRHRLPRRVRAGAAEVRPRSSSLEEALEGADLAVIVTAHPGIDHIAIADAASAGRLPRGHPHHARARARRRLSPCPLDGLAGGPRRWLMKRLMIVADHSFVVQAIRLALRQTAGFQVVGFVDGRSAVRGAARGAAPGRRPRRRHAGARPRDRPPARGRRRGAAGQGVLLTLRMDDEWLVAGLRGRRRGRDLQDGAPRRARHAAARDRPAATSSISRRAASRRRRATTAR